MIDEELAREFNNLRGKVLGLIEAAGLPQALGEDGRRQETAIKSLFKSLTYDTQKRIKELLEEAR